MDDIAFTSSRPIEDAVAALTAAMDLPLAARPRAAADALAPLLCRANLLDGCDCSPRADRYARRLIHADPLDRFVMLSLVWCPGQASPIHAHRVWCAFGVHCGTLSESHFAPPAADGLPSLRSRIDRRAGDAAHGPASPDLIHQIANRGDAVAISIHVYGIGVAGMETEVNRIYG